LSGKYTQKFPKCCFFASGFMFYWEKVQDARQTSKDVGANVEGDLEAAKNTAERIMDQQLANR
jgi:hypothetical protein